MLVVRPSHYLQRLAFGGWAQHEAVVTDPTRALRLHLHMLLRGCFVAAAFRTHGPWRKEGAYPQGSPAQGLEAGSGGAALECPSSALAQCSKRRTHFRKPIEAVKTPLPPLGITSLFPSAVGVYTVPERL